MEALRSQRRQVWVARMKTTMAQWRGSGARSFWRISRTSCGRQGSKNHKPLRPTGKTTKRLLIGRTRTGEAPARQALESDGQHPLGRPPIGTIGWTVGMGQHGRQTVTRLCSLARLRRVFRHTARHTAQPGPLIRDGSPATAAMAQRRLSGHGSHDTETAHRL